MSGLDGLGIFWIIMIILFVCFNFLACWVLVASLKKKKMCESVESIGCPPYSCANKDKDCGIKPYRNGVNGKQCLTYLSEGSIPKTSKGFT